MSIPASAAPTVGADDADFSAWSFEDAISEMAQELGVDALAAAPDDSPADAADQPASDEGPEKPDAAVGAKAEEQQGEASPGDDDGKDAQVIPRTKAEEMRATAQRERDLARNEAAKLQEQLAQTQRQLEENEFQRGVQLRAIQLLEERPDLTVAQANRQAWGEMTQRRETAVQFQQRVAAEQQTQARVTDAQQLAAQQASENLYLTNINNWQREATKLGVPTFDVQTAAADLMMQDRWERRIDAINNIANPAVQKQAASDFYDDLKDVVLAQAAKLVQAKENRKPAIAARQRASDGQTPIRVGSASEFANIDVAAMIADTFAPDNYERELQAHPKLTIKR